MWYKLYVSSKQGFFCKSELLLSAALLTARKKKGTEMERKRLCIICNARSSRRISKEMHIAHVACVPQKVRFSLVRRNSVKGRNVVLGRRLPCVSAVLSSAACVSSCRAGRFFWCLGILVQFGGTLHPICLTAGMKAVTVKGRWAGEGAGCSSKPERFLGWEESNRE